MPKLDGPIEALIQQLHSADWSAAKLISDRNQFGM
jgi:hypothetical protein